MGIARVGEMGKKCHQAGTWPGSDYSCSLSRLIGLGGHGDGEGEDETERARGE
jgi:hypothetical protein